jgi:hypothetical protein
VDEMNLHELTGFESGVVVFKESGEAYIANWSGFDGIPRMFANALFGLGNGNDIQITDNDEFDDIAVEIASANAPKNYTINGRYENDEVIIFTFNGWD